MKIRSEVKVGLIGLFSILILIWGINFLKGRNVMSSTYTLYTFYPETGGLESSSPVLMHGVKIGYVDQVVLRTDSKPSILLSKQKDQDFIFGKGSVAELFSADLMGTKAIRIIPSGANMAVSDRDTLMSTVAMDLLNTLETRMLPVIEQIGHLAHSLDTLSNQLHALIVSDTLANTLDHLNSITGALNSSLAQGGSLDRSFSNLESFTEMLNANKEEMTAIVGHLNSISETVDSAGLDQLAHELVGVSHHLNLLLEQVNSGDGNAGKFFYSDSLYINLEHLVVNLDHLVTDLNENPEDYVQISVFGKSNRKK